MIRNITISVIKIEGMTQKAENRPKANFGKNAFFSQYIYRLLLSLCVISLLCWR